MNISEERRRTAMASHDIYGGNLKTRPILFAGRTTALAIAFAAFLVALPLASADVELPRILGNNMVLQRGIPVPVWGWADAGEAVSVTLGPHTVKTTAGPDGSWRVALPALDAGGPFEMIFEGKNTVTLRNVLVGEVWICSGQSNMEWSVSRSNNAEEEIAQANHGEIRLFHVPRRTSGRPLENVNTSWRICHPETVPGFSAVAYFFGREVNRELGVPVGLINTSWGGTRIEPWTPPVGFASVTETAGTVKEIERANAVYRDQVEKSLQPLEDWIEAARGSLKSGKDIPSLPAIPRHPYDRHDRPAGLYNAMIHPLAPFALRGALWYQGEANRGDGPAYHPKMKALINGWRSVWGQGDFPFYFVQLAPFRYGGDPLLLPLIWEAQKATLALPNTGMAVTTDITNLGDIHPRNKQDVGKRLALWALAQIYGFKDLVYSGPLYESMTIEDGAIRVRFNHVGGGLASRDGKALSWFEIAGSDRTFHKAEARIDGDSVVVSSDAVPEPKAVRLGWHQEAEPNLMNKEGLPASPFRTDSW
jgi:sialate O-acetylesterase